jgi:hypothetical protein
MSILAMTSVLRGDPLPPETELRGWVDEHISKPSSQYTQERAALCGVVAALLHDSTLWKRVVGDMVAVDRHFRNQLKFGAGMDKDDLGPYPTEELMDGRLRGNIKTLLDKTPGPLDESILAALPGLSI